MLDYTCVGNLSLGIIDYRIALKIIDSFKNLMLESERPEIKFPQTVVEKSVDLTGKYNLFSQSVKILTVREIVSVKTYFTSFQQLFKDFCVSILLMVIIRERSSTL